MTLLISQVQPAPPCWPEARVNPVMEDTLKGNFPMLWRNRAAPHYIPGAPGGTRVRGGLPGELRRMGARGRGRIAFPWPMYAFVWLLAALPDPLVNLALRGMPEKR